MNIVQELHLNGFNILLCRVAVEKSHIWYRFEVPFHNLVEFEWFQGRFQNDFSIQRMKSPFMSMDQTLTQSASNRENLSGLRRECVDASQNDPMVLSSPSFMINEKHKFHFYKRKNSNSEQILEHKNASKS